MGRLLLILLDTHVSLWLALEPDRISALAAQAIAENSDGQIAISAISLYEVATAAHRRRIDLYVPLDSFLRDLQTRVELMPITAETAAHAAQLPTPYPRDPFDRIIGATAIVAGLPLVTADRAIRDARMLRVIW